MDDFSPEKFLGEIFWDEDLPPANQFASSQYTEIPRIGFGRENFPFESNSQNTQDVDEPLPPANQSEFLQHIYLPRVGFGQESSHNRSLPPAIQSAFGQNSDLPIIGFEQESSYNGSTSCSCTTMDGLFPPADRSAFVQYRDLPRIGFGQESSNSGSNSRNTSRRMIEFLRKSWPVEGTNVAEYERERGFRHMINERMRRQRQRQGCLALHSILPNGTKNDINSVIQMAAKEIQRLQACRDELQRQKFELEANLQAEESSKVQFKVANPRSSIDSMLEILQFLKDLGVNTKSITSNFSPDELFAILQIET